MGAMPTIFHTADDKLWSRIPGLGPHYQALLGKLSDGMQRLDLGYRAAMLEHLDKANPAKDALTEYQKGRTIAEHLGDPRNQDWLVRTFEAIGGPFVAFRLGIAPRNVLSALVEHPGRVVMGPRLENDLQRNRQNPNGPNEISMGGPTDDTAQELFDPIGYALNPATSGELGSLVDQHFANGGVGASGTSVLGNTLQYNVPGGSVAHNVAGAIGGTAMPGQHMTLADKLALSIINAFGPKLKKKTPAYIEQKERKAIHKQEQQ